MKDKQVLKSKVKQIQEELADKTGVSSADVGKILTSLGLEGALLNRISKKSSDPRNALISLEQIRISAGMPSPPI